MPSQKKVRTVGNIAVPAAYLIRKGWRIGAPAPYTTQFSYGPAISRRSGTDSNILYQTGNDGRFRPCVHDTKKYLASPVSSWVSTWDDSATMTNHKYPGMVYSGLPQYYHQLNYSTYLSAASSVSNPIDTLQWAALGQQALDAMMPTFNGQNSLVNFILELKDFKRLASTIGDSASTALDVIKAAIGFRDWHKPARKISSAYLSYQFAWAPFFRDISNLVTALRAFSTRFELLKRMANTDLQAHFRTMVVGTSATRQVTYNSGELGAPGNDSTTNLRGITQVVLGETKGVSYSATLRYRYPMPVELLTAGGQAKAFLDTLGVSVDPSILWNAIPFTFVVDWFINVGKWLRRLRVDNIRFQTEIRDFCHSAKYTRDATYMTKVVLAGHSTISNIQSSQWSDWWVTDAFTRTSYRRYVGIPDFLQSMQTSGLNVREFLLAGALARANRR